MTEYTFAVQTQPMSLVDQLREVRDVAIERDEDVRHAGATVVGCHLALSMEQLDRIILELDDAMHDRDRARASARAARWYFVAVALGWGLGLAAIVVL